MQLSSRILLLKTRPTLTLSQRWSTQLVWNNHGWGQMMNLLRFASTSIMLVAMVAEAAAQDASSRLIHINENYAKAANKYRIAGPVAKLNFGRVEVDWSMKLSAQVALRVINMDGSIEFTQRLSLEEL